MRARVMSDTSLTCQSSMCLESELHAVGSTRSACVDLEVFGRVGASACRTEDYLVRRFCRRTFVAFWLGV